MSDGDDSTYTALVELYWSLAAARAPVPSGAWGSDIEIERRNRIKLSVAAYAYEVLNESFMSDHEFDALCLVIRPQMPTGNRRLDAFFRKHFDPSTGQWVNKHPEKARLRDLYLRHYQNGT